MGLGVDGSASNDIANLMDEARQAMLLQRVQNGADAMSARGIGNCNTRRRGYFGRLNGRIAVGNRADIAIWDINGMKAQGAGIPLHWYAGPMVRHLFVEGRQIVRDWHMATLDLPKLIEAQNRLALKLAG